jgi:hypothetical protein
VERTQSDVIAKAALLVALVAAALPGCCDLQQRHEWQPRAVESHLVFGPLSTDPAPENVLRVEWPSTTAYADPAETIAYREVVMDRQGWFGAENDRPYRRFDSVRTGRTRR